MTVTARGLSARLLSGGCRSWPELKDDVDRGLGDLPEPAEAGVVGQLPYRCGAGLGAAGLGQGGRRALEPSSIDGWLTDLAARECSTSSRS